MPKYEVRLIKLVRSELALEVEANNVEDAKELAYEMQHNKKYYPILKTIDSDCTVTPTF